MKKNLHIAVSGLSRGENPQPGLGIIRSIRRNLPDAFVIGLAYDAMESGIYVEGGPNETHLMPFPAAGMEPFFERLDAIRNRTQLDIYIPTLDSEIDLLAHAKDEFAQRGIRVCLPDTVTLRRRAKQHLPALAAACGARVPETRIANDAHTAVLLGDELGYPLIVKGPYYDAKLAHSPAELAAAVTRLLSEWGGPVILQRCAQGPEFNALGIGDGRGGLLGLCCIRKTLLSEKGKGQGGITIDDPRLSGLCARVVRTLKWPGPFELEVILDAETNDYVIIEMNPRFPAWVDFPSMIGANFPAALVTMLAGEEPAPLPACPAGRFYIRHQIEVAGRVEDFATLFGDAPCAPADAPAASKPVNRSRLIL